MNCERCFESGRELCGIRDIPFFFQCFDPSLNTVGVCLKIRFNLRRDVCLELAFVCELTSFLKPTLRQSCFPLRLLFFRDRRKGGDDALVNFLLQWIKGFPWERTLRGKRCPSPEHGDNGCNHECWHKSDTVKNNKWILIKKTAWPRISYRMGNDVCL